MIADLAEPAGIAVLSALEDVDILVDNAGFYRFLPTAATDEALFDAFVATNLRAPFRGKTPRQRHTGNARDALETLSQQTRPS